MVNHAMSRSVAPLVVTIGLALAAGAQPLAAQRAETIARSTRVAAGDSLEPKLRRLERSIDSLLRVFHDDGLSGERRLRLSQLIDERVAEFTAMRMAGARPRERNVFVRIPEPVVGDGRLGGDPLFPRIAPASMVPGWIGIVVSGAPTQIRVENNEMFMRYLTYPEIASVDPRSPAQRAGVAPGDTLMAYDGRDVRREEISMTKLLQPKATVKLRVRRDGKVREMPVVVAEAPARIKLRRDRELHDSDAAWVPVPRAPMIAQTPPAAPVPRSFFPTPGRTIGTTQPVAPRPPVFAFSPSGFLGAQFITVSESIKRNLGLAAGVLVTTVTIGSPAGESGLEEGDVIVRVGDQSVTDVFALRDHIARAYAEGSRSLSVELRRGKDRRTLTLRW